MILRPHIIKIFPYTTLFRSDKSEEKKKEVTEYFWNPYELKYHDADQPIVLGKKQDYENDNNLELAELMEKFMREFKLVRLSGPYRNKEFGGGVFAYDGSLKGKYHNVLGVEYIEKAINMASEIEDRLKKRTTLAQELITAKMNLIGKDQPNAWLRAL